MNAVSAKRHAPRNLASKQRRQHQNMIQTLVLWAGSQQVLADALGVSQAAVSKWVIRGWLPVERAIQVEMLYGIPPSATADPRLISALACIDSLTQPKGRT